MCMDGKRRWRVWAVSQHVAGSGERVCGCSPCEEIFANRRKGGPQSGQPWRLEEWGGAQCCALGFEQVGAYAPAYFTGFGDV
jgi:hypothetical protein